jgi:phage terminase Nu1 subunit (DNA packaging protein)
MAGEVVSLNEARERRARQHGTQEQLLSKKELAATMGVTPRTVDRWVAKGLPVALRLWGGSGAPRFHLSACTEWHASQE